MMELACSFCGKPFTCFDGYVRKYCPECQKSGRRYAAQFKERRKNDPVVDIYAYQYGKRHALYKKGKIPKATLDEWRHQVRIKRHEISMGKITVEDFKVWCDETYNAVKPISSRGGSVPPRGGENMTDYSKEAMQALAEYIKAVDKCANEPDETYGAAFIAMEPIRERVKQFFTGQEFEAIIINLDEIRKVLRDAEVSFEQ